MSTSTAETIARQGETKLCPSSGPALELLGMKEKARIKREAAEDAARLLKATFRLRAPIDPIAIAQELGIQVLEGELDRDQLGGLVMEPDKEPQIYMNRLDLLVRRRLTCTIELGYYVRLSARTNKYSRVDRRSDCSKSEPDPDSVYAEGFAVCLLLPDKDVQVMTELGVDELEIALRFQVSRELVQLRLNDLGLRTVNLLEA